MTYHCEQCDQMLAHMFVAWCIHSSVHNMPLGQGSRDLLVVVCCGRAILETT